MLKCRICMLWSRSALDVPNPTTHYSRRLRDPLHLSRQTRPLYTTTRHTEPDTDTRTWQRSAVELRSTSRQVPWKTSTIAANPSRQERTAPRRERPQKSVAAPNLERLGRRDPSIPQQDWDNRKRELRHLQDPVKLARFVKQELCRGKATEMLQLVRMASRSMPCVVSWNFIIEHLLARGKVNDALKVYNDMKKRAQFPDAYTYSVLLRGLSINAHTSGVLSKAMSVYHSLWAPNSRVEPSIIHTNAALRVCARAMDMDALWGIVAKIPETGPASASVITYVTILNAIRQTLTADAPLGEPETEAAARIERGILDGRRIWEEIVAKCRKADLRIDEELVCAMGRLLLAGCRPRDWDDVLSLVEQTMNIPRFVPRLGTAERKQTGLVTLQASTVPTDYRFDDDRLSPDETGMRGDDFFFSLPPRGDGKALSNALTYVQPGNNTLSLVLEACQKISASSAAQKYWDLFTNPASYNIVPDLNNIHMHLRLLRQNGASSDAVKVVDDYIVANNLTPKPGTFRIVMSTCVRDKNNRDSLKNAGKVLQIMLNTQEDADSKTVGMYATLALNFPLAEGQNLVDALTILNPLVKNIRLQLGVGGEGRHSRYQGATYLKGQEREDAINVLRKVNGLYDKLITSNLIQQERKAPFKVERARLSSFLQRTSFKDDRDRNERSPATAQFPREKPGIPDSH